MRRRSVVYAGLIVWIFQTTTQAFSITASRQLEWKHRLKQSRRQTTLQMTFQENAVAMPTNATLDPMLLTSPNYPNLSLTFSDDPLLERTRKAAFDRFLTVMASLAAWEGEGAILCTTKDELIETLSDDTVHVNSLVFQVSGGLDPILVIVPATEKVDTTKLEEFLALGEADERVSVRLAPASIVEQVCGFPPGSVPPLGHSPGNLRTIVDERLVQEGVTRILGGGGHPEYGCLIKVETLLNFDGVEIADLVLESPTKINPTASFGKQANGESNPMINGATEPRDATPNPFFPVSPPPTTIAELVFQDKNVTNPLKPVFVTLLGRVTGVRRMARRLVFLDFAPPDTWTATTASEDDAPVLPWRSGLDGQDMAVQLIAGKTLCNRLGDVEGPAALRRLRPGQLILVNGKTNVGNRESLGNWARKRSLDIVMFSYEILENSALQKESDETQSPTFSENTVMESMKSNAELRRIQLAASVSSTPIATLKTGIPRKPRPIPLSRPVPNVSCLTLNDVFESSSTVTIVDSVESVNCFAEILSQLLLSLSTSAGRLDDAANIPGMEKVGLVGVDCEWKPSYMMNSPTDPAPVLLLQISLHALRRVFLFDTQALFRPLLDASETMSALEATLSETLLDLFSSKRLLKVGFQLAADLRRLASSYPHIPAFRVFHSVVELSTVAKKAMHMSKARNVRFHVTSLARLTEFMTGKTLDKEEQVSDWGNRPMTKEQIEYASLDAAVSPFLLEKSLELAEASVIVEDTPASTALQLGRWKDDTAFINSVMSWRFLLLDTDDPKAIRKLKAKKIVVAPYIVTQYWPTGAKPPKLPSVPSQNGDGPYTDVTGVLCIPAHTVRIKRGEHGQSAVSHLVGERIGRSKEKCVETLARGDAAVPNGAKIEYHQRSGYVEFNDGVALFVNMPDKSHTRSYPNEWLDEGKIMTWYLRGNEWMGGQSDLAQKLCGHHASAEVSEGKVNSDSAIINGEAKPVVVLFVRMTNGSFLCCGQCRVVVPRQETFSAPDDKGNGGNWGLIQLQLELLDWDKLNGSIDFDEMVTADIGAKGVVDDKVQITEADVMSTKSSKPKDTFQSQSLEDMVIGGNVVGALSVSLKKSGVNLEDRSLSLGLQTLKDDLRLTDTADAKYALDIIDEIANKLGS